MNQAARDKLTKARTQLILDQPFFGTLALQLMLRENSDIPTLRVSTKVVEYNPEFILGLSAQLTKSAMAHEVMHNVLGHMRRRGGRNPRKWNRAGDYVINLILKDSGFDIGETWLLDPQYAGMSTDHVYQLLPDSEPGGSGDNPLDEIDEDDDHVAEADWKINTAQAARAAKNAGKMPGSLQRFVEEVLEAQVDWREVLRRFVTNIGKGDYSWSRPSTRYLSRGLYMPSLYSEHMGTLVAVSDDSGSIDGPILNAMSSEIDSICSAVSPEKVLHISCDARINHIAEFQQGDPFKMVSKGGGSTDFRPPFDHLEKEGIKPECLIYLTDGYGPFPAQEPGYPVLWCMTSDVIPPWGEHVRIEV